MKGASTPPLRTAPPTSVNPPDGSREPEAVPARGLLRRWDLAVSEWDRHMVGCPGCLSEGEWFCPEGDYLTEEVRGLRNRIASSARPPRKISFALVVGARFRWEVTAHLP